MILEKEHGAWIMSKNKDKSASELLNIYINSGGDDCSYDEVVEASRKEQLKLKIKESKEKRPYLIYLLESLYLRLDYLSDKIME